MAQSMVGMDDAEHFHAMQEPASSMQMENMKGQFGLEPMIRDASGTSWQPDNTPMMGMHAMSGEWSTMVHGSTMRMAIDRIRR